MSGLNPEQQEAVRTQSGPLLVLAGAGTGKTRVITHRKHSCVRSRIASFIARVIAPRKLVLRV